jgi:hypothetical protein
VTSSLKILDIIRKNKRWEVYPDFAGKKNKTKLVYSYQFNKIQNGKPNSITDDVK